MVEVMLGIYLLILNGMFLTMDDCVTMYACRMRPFSS